jgi:hypothetical protein
MAVARSASVCCRRRCGRSKGTLPFRVWRKIGSFDNAAAALQQPQTAPHNGSGRFAMTVEPREFHFEEYKHLKQQISSLLDRVTTIIQFILGAAAAVYAWVITNGVNAAAGMWTPVVLFFVRDDDGDTDCLQNTCDTRFFKNTRRISSQFITAVDRPFWRTGIGVGRISSAGSVQCPMGVDRPSVPWSGVLLNLSLSTRRCGYSRMAANIGAASSHNSLLCLT